MGVPVKSDKSAPDYGMATRVNNYVAIKDASIKKGTNISSKNVVSENYKVGQIYQ